MYSRDSFLYSLSYLGNNFPIWTPPLNWLFAVNFTTSYWHCINCIDYLTELPILGAGQYTNFFTTVFEAVQLEKGKEAMMAI